ncbi:MAG: DUF2871 domain-containing protein [Oscillospiraceae bacterium]|jgi:hypothetical protein|nr:DUF2871 domain-containing protein [Oscillospiraceae bacterium]
MEKKYMDLSLAYALVAMALGVFYREYTKLSGFAGATRLSVLHTHYFMLGMFFFLVLALAEKAFQFSDKAAGRTALVYQVGLNITGLGLLVRGLTQVWGGELSRGMDASLSGVSGIGHILLGVAMVMLLLKIRKKAA